MSTKTCQTCGTRFAPSRADFTVNCPACRKGRRAKTTSCVVCGGEREWTERTATGRTRTVACWKCTPTQEATR